MNDVPCDASSYSIDDLTNPPNGTVVTMGFYGEFEYTPNQGFIGSDSFTYTLYENQQVVDQATVHITVTATCSVVAYSDYLDGTDFQTPLYRDAPGVLEDDTVECVPYTVEVGSPPTNGSVTVSDDGAFTYTPAAGFSGIDKFSYEIRDAGQAVMGLGVAKIKVFAPPCAALDDAYSTVADTALAVGASGLLGNDIVSCFDFGSATQLGQAPSSGVATVQADGSFEYVPDPGFVGQDSFIYELYGTLQQSGEEVVASATVVIDVTEVPAPTEPGDTTTTGPGDTEPGDSTTTTQPASEPGVSTTEDGTTSSEPDAPPTVVSGPPSSVPAGGLRIATFNASLSRATAGELVADLSTPDDQQARNVAAILQHTRPDVVLLNEFDYVAGGAAVDSFRSNYLLASQGGLEPLEYPYYFIAPANAGLPSGLDLDNDGTVGGPGDAFGIGEFPGQHGMVMLSRFPILENEVRTFQNLLWASMPGARLPDDPTTPDPNDWYSPDELAVLRLSSKSHWDVPIDFDSHVVHVLASHPTPVFDGPEDRNGLRNADEIAFWADYVAGIDVGWIVDDAGAGGGLDANAEFVIVGDLNSDPLDGDSLPGATDQLLALDQVQDAAPASAGATQAADAQHRANAVHAGDPSLDTADFTDDAIGNLRVDYVLPSDGFAIVNAGVFWPLVTDELARLVATGRWRPPTIDSYGSTWREAGGARLAEPSTRSSKAPARSSSW